jgi:hypothetical protein
MRGRPGFTQEQPTFVDSTEYASHANGPTSYVWPTEPFQDNIPSAIVPMLPLPTAVAYGGNSADISHTAYLPPSEDGISGCRTCGKTFSSNAQRNRHERTVCGKEIHRCPQCQKTYTRKDNLRRHRKSSHQGTVEDYADHSPFFTHFQELPYSAIPAAYNLSTVELHRPDHSAFQQVITAAALLRPPCIVAQSTSGPRP